MAGVAYEDGHQDGRLTVRSLSPFPRKFGSVVGHSKIRAWGSNTRIVEAHPRFKNSNDVKIELKNISKLIMLCVSRRFFLKLVLGQ